MIRKIRIATFNDGEKKKKFNHNAVENWKSLKVCEGKRKKKNIQHIQALNFFKMDFY